MLSLWRKREVICNIQWRVGGQSCVWEHMFYYGQGLRYFFIAAMIK